jgi:hypothetical protein
MSVSEYRRMAAQCQELAERMSLNQDRARLMRMAQRWLDLAETAEKKNPSLTPISNPPVVHQQVQQQQGHLKDEEEN